MILFWFCKKKTTHLFNNSRFFIPTRQEKSDVFFDPVHHYILDISWTWIECVYHKKTQLLNAFWIITELTIQWWHVFGTWKPSAAGPLSELKLRKISQKRLQYGMVTLKIFLSFKMWSIGTKKDDCCNFLNVFYKWKTTTVPRVHVPHDKYNVKE